MCFFCKETDNQSAQTKNACLFVWSPGRLVVWSPGRLVVWSSGRLVVCRPCCGPAMDHRTDAPRNENRKLEPKAVPGEFQAQGVLRAAAENVRTKVCRELVPKLGSLLVPDFGGQRKVTYGFVPFRCPPKTGVTFGTRNWNPKNKKNSQTQLLQSPCGGHSALRSRARRIGSQRLVSSRGGLHEGETVVPDSPRHENTSRATRATMTTKKASGIRNLRLAPAPPTDQAQTKFTCRRHPALDNKASVGARGAARARRNKCSCRSAVLRGFGPAGSGGLNPCAGGGRLRPCVRPGAPAGGGRGLHFCKRGCATPPGVALRARGRREAYFSTRRRVLQTGGEEKLLRRPAHTRGESNLKIIFGTCNSSWLLSSSLTIQ